MPRRITNARAFAWIARALELDGTESVAHLQTDEAIVAYDPAPAIEKQVATHWIFGLGDTAPANAFTEFVVNPFDRSDWTGVHKDGVRQTATAQGAGVDNAHDFYLTGAGFFFEGGTGVFGNASLYVRGEPDILGQVVRMGLAKWDSLQHSVAVEGNAPVWLQPMPWYMPFRPYANVGTDVFDLTLLVNNTDPANFFNFDFWLTGVSAPPGYLRRLYAGG